MKLKNLFAGFLIGALLLTPINGFAEGSSQMIKVGLYYGGSGKSSYNLGNSAMDFYEGSNLIASINSWGKYSASTISTIYTTGEYFSDYNLATNRAAKMGSAFVYYDGVYYYVASKNIQGEMVNTLIDNEAVIINVDGVPVFSFSSEKEIAMSNSDNTFTIEGSSYRGQVILKSDGSKMSAINYVDMDQYLKGVVGREMSSSWEIEALKAQAVVARNYATMSMSKHSSSGFNICATTHCQVYGGMKAEASTIDLAVDATKGELIYYNGQIAQAYYSSSSGGKTENNENVWGSAAIPYLRGVEDPYSIGYPNDNWTVELTAAEIKGALANRGVNVGEIVDVKITKTSDMGRAIELTVLGTKGTKVFSKDGIRSSIAPESLKSTLFTVEKTSGGVSSLVNNVATLHLPTDMNTELFSAYTNLNNVLPKSYSTGNTGADKYVINGHGWGHGIGMSQYGAKDMAKKGFDYEAILKYYFTGIEIR